MTGRFTIDDDPAQILQFTFLNSEGRITKASFKAALRPPYPAKYYINAILTLLGVLIFLLWNYGVIPGTKLGFFCNDQLFSHKYRGDTIPPWLLGIGLVFLFPSVYFTIENIRHVHFKDAFSLPFLFEFYVYVKQFIIGLILVGGVTEIAKTIVGEHRPHFFDTCRPDGNLNCTNGTYVFDFVCTNRNVSVLDQIDSSRSFPSGHSSISWFSALFSAFLVHSRLPIQKTGTSFKIFMFMICITFGLTCSLTRITDRRHHWWDVLIGTLIGAVGAVYVIQTTRVQVDLLRRKEIEDETKPNENSHVYEV